jgi:hypothetical protein
MMTMTTRTRTATVAARKKTKHGGYGRELARVEFEIQVDAVSGFGDERAVHAEARAKFAVLLPGLKIATDIVNW